MRRSRIATLLLAAGVIASSSFASGLKGPDDLGATIRSELGVETFELTRVEVPPTLGEPFFTVVEFAGESFTLDLQPHSVRAPGFEVLVDRGEEALEPVPAPPISTYRGSLVEVPGSEVNASIVGGNLRAIMWLGEGQIFELLALNEIMPDSAPEFYVVTDVMDAQEGPWVCGNTLVNGLDRHDHADEDHGNGGGGFGIDEVMAAEIAYDADVEFYNRNGQSVDQTVADIESVTNGMNNIYERDVEIVHVITRIIVRTQEPDPYTTTDPGSLLSQFQSEWNRNQGGVQRDIAHLMTGKNLNGGVIGIAFLGTICSRTYGYGLSESKFSIRFSSRVALTSHEVGHNWNAGHCSSNCNSGSDCRIMCPCLGGCSGDVSRFGTTSKNSISRFRDSRNCLEPFNQFQVSSTPLFGGEIAEFYVTGGASNAEVRVYYSLQGEGSCFIADLNVTLDLQNCRLGLSGTTDSNGDKTWSTRIPRIGRNARLLWVQAAQTASKSNLYLTQINP